jgi:orotidine-5'-phosphate decarboxylase
VTFGERLAASFDATGHVCVGIDPHASLLREWGLRDDAAGAQDFGLRVVDAVAGRAGIVKPQVAFYERYGSAGFAALETVLSAARSAGILTIGDAKRGDIGSTMDGYCDAWLRQGSSLEVDALTVSGYLGVDSLTNVDAFARANDKGIFVLAATSNPEARQLQAARGADGATVAASIVTTVHHWNETDSDLGSSGVVVGATVDLATVGLSDGALVGMPILAPGFGFQGAHVSNLRSLFGSAADTVIVSSSRGILSAGPDGIAQAIAAEVTSVRKAYSS